MSNRLLSVLILFFGLTAITRADGDYALADARLKIVKIDTDTKESLLALASDGMGRIFAGGREALFVYEPQSQGLYQLKHELYRFPSNSWVYNIAIRGHDLYALTVSALYVFPGGAVKRSGLRPKRLLWGLPVAHDHQGFHGMEFGPDGDLYISLGDQTWYYGSFRTRPDHWGHCNLYHGPDETPLPYTGVGGVLRMSPDGKELAVVANGTRNDCGLAFDKNWNLFGTDNDHESIPSDYVPGRMLHITPGAYFNWPRGWMPEKQPWRFDLLETMTPNLGRYVPVGMCYYDDDFLPAEFRNNLFVARWENHCIPRSPIQSSGDTFKAEEQPFLTGTGDVRPLNIISGRGGRLFAVICYMDKNEESPLYRSDLVMITRKEDPMNAPFRAFDVTTAATPQLLQRLASGNWSERRAAELELTRRNPVSVVPTSPDLIWLAAEERAKLIPLTAQGSADIRSSAFRALARFGAGVLGQEIFAAGLLDADPQVRLAALAGFFDPGVEFSFDKVATLAVSTIQDAPDNTNFSYLRQTACALIARRAAMKEISALCESPDSKRRLIGVIAAGFKLTMPVWDAPLKKSVSLDPGLNRGVVLTYADGVTVDLRQRGPVGVFTMADAWDNGNRDADDETLFALLQHRLVDADESVTRQAAYFLHLLNDARAESQVAEILTPFSNTQTNTVALKNIASTGTTELPAAFRGLDWASEAAKGDPRKGQQLFATRGCATCHSIHDGDTGSGGPSLKGAGGRFSLTYIAESILVPNKSVSPLFRWTMLKLKDGDEFSGLITGETGAEVEVLLPSTVRRTVKKSNIASRDLQNRSPMPEGLVTTPSELDDLLAFLHSQKE